MKLKGEVSMKNNKISDKTQVDSLQIPLKWLKREKKLDSIGSDIRPTTQSLSAVELIE